MGFKKIDCFLLFVPLLPHILTDSLCETFNLDMFSPRRFSASFSTCCLSSKEKRSGSRVIYIMFLNFWVDLPFTFNLTGMELLAL